MSDLAGKKLLILGSSVVNCKYVNAAKELGVYTIVTDNNERGPAKAIADEALSLSVFDVQGIIDYCQKNHVDGVANYSNTFSQPTQQKVCDALGLPSFGTAEQYKAFTDKIVFKNACRKYGVDVIPEFSVDDLDSVVFPVIVKPSDNSGSRGISSCSNMEELIIAIDKAKRECVEGDIIIEECMKGYPDFSVTLMIVDGEPCLVRTVDRILGLKEDGLEQQCICGVCPSRYTDMYLKTTHERVVRMIKGLGLKNGPVFIQGFIDGDTIRFYDPGIRFPGSDYDLLYRKATNIDLVNAAVKLPLKGNLDITKNVLTDSYLLNGKTAVQLHLPARSGVIGTYEGFDDLYNIPGVVYVSQKSYLGATIRATGNVSQRTAEVGALIDSYDDLASFAESVYHTVRIRDLSGEDMIVSKLNCNMVK